MQLLLRHPGLLPFFLLCLAIGTLPSVGNIVFLGSALFFKVFIIVCILDAFKKQLIESHLACMLQPFF
jgi:hypothetical protein